MALLSVALCAIGLCAFAAGQASAAGRYVAFGDSGTTGSGLGATTGVRPLCWQTANSYPEYLKSAMGFTDFATAACSAAWINDFTTEQELFNPSTMTYEEPAPPQFNTLNGSETLITISIGDNDSGYGDIVKNCLEKATPSVVCKDDNPYFNSFVSRANALLSNPLGEAIDEAHRRSPNAEIWVIGYPRLIPEDVSNCSGRVNISAADAPIVNDWQKAVNNTEKATTEAHDAYYVDVFSQSDGHDSCQPNAADRWTNPGQAATTSGWSLHPTIAGHLAVANLFLTAFNSPRPLRPIKPGPDGKLTTPIGQTLDLSFRSKKVRSVTSSLAPITKTVPTKNGARLAVKLARSATVDFRIDHAKPGRIKNGKCRAMSRRAGKGRKACTRYIAVKSKVTLALPGGTSNVYFTGRAGGKQLSEGKYRLRAVLGALSAKTPTFKLSK